MRPCHRLLLHSLVSIQGVSIALFVTFSCLMGDPLLFTHLTFLAQFASSTLQAIKVRSFIYSSPWPSEDFFACKAPQRTVKLPLPWMPSGLSQGHGPFQPNPSVVFVYCNSAAIIMESSPFPIPSPSIFSLSSYEVSSSAVRLMRASAAAF